MSGNFAFAGIDMALCDLCGKASEQPLYNLFGGLQRDWVDYFYYLSYGEPADIVAQAERGAQQGYDVFYLKVGIDVERELEMVAALRSAIGPKRKIRIDANGAWHVNEAIRYLEAFDAYRIDFAEQPVWPEPVENMLEVRRQTPVALCANEGLWRVCDVHEVIKRRAADVLCFSSNWVGTLGQFHRLSWQAHGEGLQVCRHTHGELGLMAAASHHVCLTLPNLVDGNQQVAAMMEDDILCEPVPTSTESRWGVPQGVGLCVEVDEEKVAHYHALYTANTVRSCPTVARCLPRRVYRSKRLVPSGCYALFLFAEYGAGAHVAQFSPFNGNRAVDQHVVDPLWILIWRLEVGAFADGIWVKYEEVGAQPFAQESAIG